MTLSGIGNDEKFLENAIRQSPELLGLSGPESLPDTHGDVHRLGRRTLTRQDGKTVKPDILLLSERGSLTVVEVKLSDNPEFRGRGPVAQPSTTRRPSPGPTRQA